MGKVLKKSRDNKKNEQKSVFNAALFRTFATVLHDTINKYYN